MDLITITPDGKAFSILLLLVLAVPILSAGFAFRHAIASSPMIWLSSSVVVVGLIVWGLTFLSAKIATHPDKITLSAIITSTEIPSANVKWSDAQAVFEDKKLSIRTMGVGFPGFGAGWYQTKQGNKVFAIVTGKDQIRLPTCDDYDLILDKEVAEELITRYSGIPSSCN